VELFCPGLESESGDESFRLAKNARVDKVLGRRIVLMTTMNISLPEEMKHFVEAQMAQEGYASASEYLRALIREAQKRQAKQALEAKLLEGLQGPTIPMTREDWDSMEREALEGLAGETIRP
jgi:antitoxin ParD1/3/4